MRGWARRGAMHEDTCAIRCRSRTVGIADGALGAVATSGSRACPACVGSVELPLLALAGAGTHGVHALIAGRTVAMHTGGADGGIAR